MMQNQNHSGIGDNVARDKYEYHYHNIHKVPTQLTSKLGQDSIIGRIEELKKVDTLLNKSASLLLISGIGGIGKSTIASYYLHTQKEKFDYYGYFEGLESFVSELRASLDIQEEKMEESFLETLYKLRNLKGKKLLVIDNVENVEENQKKIEKILELKNSGYQILLTSRETMEDIDSLKSYPLNVLNPNDAKKLFCSIIEVKDTLLLDDILKYLDYHPLFVEMTAKTLKSKQTLTLELIKNKFENGDFSKVSRKRRESFNDYLNTLFNFDRLDDQEILLLKQLSVLPSIEIEFAFLQAIFNREDEDFEELLNFLVERGWLISHEKNYKLHQVIKEYVFQNYPPSFNEIERIGHYLNQLLVDPNIPIYLQNFQFFESYHRSLVLLKHENSKEYLVFIINLAYTYNSFARYEKAMSLYIKALSRNSNYTIYSYLGNVYLSLRKTKATYYCFKKVLRLQEQVLEQNHESFIPSYSDLAGYYLSIGNASKALKFLNKALTICMLNTNLHSQKIATIYFNMAVMYQEQKSYSKAFELYEKAIHLKMEEPKVNYKKFDNLVAPLINLGKLYFDVADFYKATPCYLKALKLITKYYGDGHLSIGNLYNLLALNYEQLREYKKALSFYLKALDIRTNILKNPH
ncbi:MAG TPA: tetratricopeptide repeat protein, partial [Arcobacter sp.]|nr:tetratricopeptide repeat protein [Arcobacter sp.]